MKKKRLILIWFILAAALALSGCSLTDNMVMRLNGWMSNQLMEKSGVIEDESYVQAQNNGEAGLLDEDGKLTEKVDVSEDEIGIGPIHVTFAQNRNITLMLKQILIKVIIMFLADSDLLNMIWKETVWAKQIIFLTRMVLSVFLMITLARNCQLNR